MMAKKLKVLFLASEADPLIKVGGLGDVAGSLPLALKSLNPAETGGKEIDVRLAIPFHSAIRQKIQKFEKIASFSIDHAHGALSAEVFLTEINGLPVYLISGPLFIPGEPVYTTDNYRDGSKYIFFSLAALKLIQTIDWKPDILHANDWHTAVTPYVIKRHPAYSDLQTISSVLTIHNLPFMGAGSERALTEFGLKPFEDSGLPSWAQLMPLPLGLASADQIVAVSASYADEILTPEFGCSLEGFLRSRQASVSGILNGLDTVSWDPSTDRLIPTAFSPEQLEKREINRQSLRQELSLNPDPAIPLLIIISRMDQQKGIDLAIEGLNQISKYPWQAVILGTGSSLLEAGCQHLQTNYPDRVRAILRFDGQLARRMYAGGDMILMPSRYEPCGLAQMIAMRYGCIPVARATGGLRDTILDFGVPGSTGFLFKEASSGALSDALVRALKLFPDRSTWQKLQLRGMHLDFSWERSALAYTQVYRSLKEQ